jgi:hypothetical protein
MPIPSRLRIGSRAAAAAVQVHVNTQIDVQLVHFDDVLFEVVVDVRVRWYASKGAEHDIRVERVRPDQGACSAFGAVACSERRTMGAGFSGESRDPSAF